MRRTRTHLLVVVLGALAAATSCISKVEPPPLAGPSELALSIQMTANPDVLTQDGASQSLIRIQARGPNAEPARSVALRAEITFNGVIVDFGRLSARTLVTDNNGQATLIYTAPPFVGDPVDTGTRVTIVVTPAETDNRNAEPRLIDIRLVPPGVILGPNSPPVPSFTITPPNPTLLQTVIFDASASTDDGVIVSFAWDFGDGTSGSGKIVQHQYRTIGNFAVTLTATDDRGVSVPTTQALSVGAGTPPTAAFTFSPGQPVVNQEIVFNGAASTAAPGRTIVRYDWNFGSGNPQSGSSPVVTKSYDTPGNYTVTLTVTDDAGLKGTTQATVNVGTVGGPVPTADFDFSPSNPRAGDTVFFNASRSQSPAGSALTYQWDFGDGTTGTGITPNHVYTQVRSYVVTLVVTDASGRRSAPAVKNVAVQ